jgi:hypothetical protein
MSVNPALLLVGEVYVDFTLPKAEADNKLRLGGIVHAARGVWAIDANYAVAAVCPGYLVDQARAYLESLGCSEFIWLAEVKGAPNVMAIGDPTELADQAYQDILSDEKSVGFLGDTAGLKAFKSCLIFPGKYDLAVLKSLLAEDVQASLDIAYDLPDLEPAYSVQRKPSRHHLHVLSDVLGESIGGRIWPAGPAARSIAASHSVKRESRRQPRVRSSH